MKMNFKHTRNACYFGYISHAIINNFAPLLFLTFNKEYGVGLEDIALLISLNFGIQLCVDLLAVKFADKIGYRTCMVAAHIFAASGLAGLCFFPVLFPNPYVGLLAAVSVSAVGGGLLEVMVSPIIEACPSTNKAGEMSLLHSFYCWGHVGAVIASSIFFACFGLENWRILACLFALIPLLNVYFFTRVPIAKLVESDEAMPMKTLFSMKIFWVFILLMICSGASELAMSQWISAFVELGLNVPKTVGDLAGSCLFAILMGVSRIIFSRGGEKMDLWRIMLYSGILCVFAYVLAVVSPFPILALIGCAACGFAVGIFWPGTISLASKHCPAGGTTLFAFLAVSGDLGCSSGPAVVGIVSGLSNNNLRLGLAAAIAFPVLLIVGLILFKKEKTLARKESFPF